MTFRWKSSVFFSKPRGDTPFFLQYAKAICAISKAFFLWKWVHRRVKVKSFTLKMSFHLEMIPMRAQMDLMMRILIRMYSIGETIVTGKCFSSTLTWCIFLNFIYDKLWQLHRLWKLYLNAYNNRSCIALNFLHYFCAFVMNLCTASVCLHRDEENKMATVGDKINTILISIFL